MSSISGSSSARAPQQTRAEPQRQPERQPKPEDARAMREAMAAARNKLGMGEEALPGGKQRKPALPGGDARQGDGKTQAQARAGSGDAALFDRARRDQQGSDPQQGLALAAGAGQVPQPVVPNMPSPVADPSAFAQMMRDLWTRENGKGAKEVRVRFGDSAWPATGATLVRTEAGTLDIALSVADRGQAFGDALPGLQAQLGAAGLEIERLALTDDDWQDA